MNSSTTSPKRKPLKTRKLLFSGPRQDRRSPPQKPPKPRPQTEEEKRGAHLRYRKRRGEGWEKFTVIPRREKTLPFSPAKLAEIEMKEAELAEIEMKKRIREDLEKIRTTLLNLRHTKHLERGDLWMRKLRKVLDTLYKNDRITQELLEDITMENVQLGVDLEKIMEYANSYFAEANEMYYDQIENCWRPDDWDYVDDDENEYLLLHNEHRGDGGVAAGGDGREMFADALSPTTSRSPPTRSPRPPRPPRPRPHTRLFDGLRF